MQPQGRELAEATKGRKEMMAREAGRIKTLKREVAEAGRMLREYEADAKAKLPRARKPAEAEASI